MSDNKFDWTTHKDFSRYYDIERKRNFWVLGYFGGGSINVVETYNLAVQMSKAINVPVESIRIDEILSSSRYKHFKYMFSDAENQAPEEGTDQMLNVFNWLSN